MSAVEHSSLPPRLERPGRERERRASKKIFFVHFDVQKDGKLPGLTLAPNGYIYYPLDHQICLCTDPGTDVLTDKHWGGY